MPAEFCCYINVAASQLREPEFVEQLRRELVVAPQIAAHLGIEITESGAMEDIDFSIAALETLHALGLRIALDDFGTGYSSLSYLKKLPVHVVKIDQSFVRGLPLDLHDVALCETMLSIARRFGFVTLAEGIENEAQARWLGEQGCRYGQGFMPARPAAWSELVARFAAPAVSER